MTLDSTGKIVNATYNITSEGLILTEFMRMIPLIGQPIVFNASLSYDPDGSIANYSWSFGDGSMASGVTTTHRYS